MSTNPQYIRLADPVRRSTLADVAGHSGFAISGYDVQEFPDDSEPKAVQFVRDNLTKGVLVEATAEAFAAAHPEEDDTDDEEAERLVRLVRAASGQTSGIQEAKVQRRAARQRKALLATAEDGNVVTDEVLTYENLDAQTKEQIAAVAKARFDLDLNTSDTKDNLITDVLEAQEERSTQP